MKSMKNMKVPASDEDEGAECIASSEGFVSVPAVVPGGTLASASEARQVSPVARDNRVTALRSGTRLARGGVTG
jgi:hypothetical protein